MAVRGCVPRAFLAVSAVLLLQVMVASRAVMGATVPPAGCSRRCGDFYVPYPFGMEDDTQWQCYLGAGFGLTCNNSFNPPKLFQGNLEVTSISLSSARITVVLNLSYNCYDHRPSKGRTWGAILAVPYTISSEENVFTAVGCDTLANFSIGRNNFGGCISGCNSLSDVADGSCNGIGCCRASIPRGVSTYRTGFLPRSNSSEAFRFNNCSYSFISLKDNYTFSKLDLENMVLERSFPVVLDFSIENKTCEEAKANKSSYACVSTNSECVSSASGDGYVCNCSQGYQGNPYLPEGCKDIDECRLSREVYPCQGMCTNIPGGYNCTCPEGQHSDDAKKIKCSPDPRKEKLPLSVKLILGLGSGIILVFIIGAAFCLEVQRRKLNTIRERHFSNNGGSFLQELLSTDSSNFKIFSLAELQKATSYFNKDQILGSGGFGAVYKGTLDDERLIAVKRSMVANEKNGREFANELFILSKVNHRHIVELLGCCLEDEAPILVYKFIPKGTLFDFIHGKNRRKIPFTTRLRIATEAAEALKYLHIDASTPILHGDVKSMNILLDEGYIAKISDFGTSKLSPQDKNQFTTLVQGTCGYLDPEYMFSGHLTAKSDVYSFGVVLVELLTRRMPFSFDVASEEERSLASMFISCMENDKLHEILDPEIVDEGGVGQEVVRVADTAMQCLNMKGRERPTMAEIVAELGGCRVRERHPWAPIEHEDTTPLVRSPSDSAPLMTRYFSAFSVELEPNNQSLCKCIPRSITKDNLMTCASN